MNWVKLESVDGRNYRIVVQWWKPSFWWEIYSWARRHNHGVLVSLYAAVMVTYEFARK